MRLMPGKRVLIPFLVSVFSLILTNAYSAPCYGTRLPGKNKVDMGLQNYTILKRYEKDGQGNFKSTQNFLLLSYGVFDWLSIDLKGGEGDINEHPTGMSKIAYDASFAGGYGFRVKFFDEKKIKAVFGFQHISVHPYSTPQEGSKHKAVLDDWQVSLLGSYSFKLCTPYLGTRWSRVDYIHWTDGERNRVNSDSGKSIGLITGIDIPLNKQIWLNAEGQFFDSSAFALSINYSF